MKYFPIFTVAMGAVVFLLPQAQAQQQAKVDIKKIRVETMPTPHFSYDGDTKSLPRSQDWVEVEVEFEAEAADRSKQYLDDLEFTYYVVLNDEAKTMLVQRVTHVNVPVKEKIFSNVFVSPSTVLKLTGSKANSASIVAGVAVEIRYQGALVGGETTEKSGGSWWQTRPQTQGMLLKKSETPFAILWWDRYAEVKKER